MAALAIALPIALPIALAAPVAQAACDKPVYWTFDTGHMEVAPLIAEVLQRQAVRVTFFAANERTKVGDGSLGEHWAPWWRERAAEGHEFASHTWSHVYWRADLPGAAPRFKVQASAGAQQGVVLSHGNALARARTSLDDLIEDFGHWSSLRGASDIEGVQERERREAGARLLEDRLRVGGQEEGRRSKMAGIVGNGLHVRGERVASTSGA
jgi:hypothetical protein